MIALKLNPLISNTWTDNNDIKDQAFTLIHRYLLALTQARNLPMTARGSFGFDHATLTDAVSPNTMRLTVGLEDDTDVTQYATIFRIASRSISNHFDNQDHFLAYTANAITITGHLNSGRDRTIIMKKTADYWRVNPNTDIPFSNFVRLCQDPEQF